MLLGRYFAGLAGEGCDATELDAPTATGGCARDAAALGSKQQPLAYLSVEGRAAAEGGHRVTPDQGSSVGSGPGTRNLPAW